MSITIGADIPQWAFRDMRADGYIKPKRGFIRINNVDHVRIFFCLNYSYKVHIKTNLSDNCFLYLITTLNLYNKNTVRIKVRHYGS